MVGRPVDATVSVVAAGGSYLMKCFVTNWVGGDRLCTASKQCVGIGIGVWIVDVNSYS